MNKNVKINKFSQFSFENWTLINSLFILSFWHPSNTNIVHIWASFFVYCSHLCIPFLPFYPNLHKITHWKLTEWRQSYRIAPHSISLYQPISRTIPISSPTPIPTPMVHVRFAELNLTLIPVDTLSVLLTLNLISSFPVLAHLGKL